MFDFILLEGDLSISKIDYDNDIETYDLDITKDIQKTLLRRSVETPQGRIGTWTLTEDGLDYIDEDFGNPLYQKLSEPLNLSWLQEALQDIKKAVSYIVDVVPVTNIEIITIGIDSVEIAIQYSNNNSETVSTTIVL